MLRVQPCFSCRYCWLMGHLELGTVRYIWVWHLHYSLYYLRTLHSIYGLFIYWKLGSTRNDVKSWFSSLVSMLSARSIFARHFLSRLHVTTWSKPFSMHQPGLTEKNTPSPKKLEKEPVVAKDAIPMSVPDSKPQEPTVYESIPAASFLSSSHPTSKSDPVLDKSSSWKEFSQYDLDVVKQRIRDRMNQTAVTLRQRADGLTVETKTKFLKLGAELNKVSGYEEIEALKKEVVEQGMFLNPNLLPPPLPFGM